MDALDTARLVDEFLLASPQACVAEEGLVLFDLTSARYSICTEHGKCVLHLWSRERNAVRRVLAAEERHGSLRLTVQRFGQSKPGKMEIWRDRDRRTPTARRAARSAYRQRLHALLERRFPLWKVEHLTSEMNLERSFGPAYTRGLMRQGRSAFAVLGVNAQELQSTIDAAITSGILWLDLCREREASRCYVEGLRLFVPRGTSAVVRERIAHLDPVSAKWQLFELEERDGSLREIDTADRGNIETRLAPCPENTGVRQRFAASLDRVTAMLGAVADGGLEIEALTGSELAFRMRGLEFVRARLESDPRSFRPIEQIVYGTGARETVLTDDNAAEFTSLVEQLARTRRHDGPRHDPLWRMAPERWLESLVKTDVSALDERLDPACVYSQVPAFAAGDRGMIDLLTITRDGRLAVLELKADEDLHLPLQGIDYWSRVVWHQQRGEFQKFGYFPGRELSPLPPLLLLVAPALHVHPTTDKLLRYLAREIDCELIGIDERWREQVRVVFRKPARSLIAAAR